MTVDGSVDGPVNGAAIVAAEHVLTPDGVLSPGWLRIADGAIAAVRPGPPPTPATHTGHWALPGFIDMHVHGGGGASFTEGGQEDARRAAAFHRANGTTRIIASLVTAPIDELERRSAMLAELADDGIIDGIHLEGPFLSAARCGAQNPRYLTLPDVTAFARLQAASRGWLRMITIAPELPGAAAVIRAATAAGAIAAAGHTDATAEATADAITAGVSHATHLFNGMRPIAHRSPGPVGALLDHPVTCEVIADGSHLDDLIIRLVARAVGPGNLVLITDAMAAAGMSDGSYRLGELDVTVSDGVARLVDAATGGLGSIAGSTATMELVVRRAITAVGLPVADVAAAASTTPARRLGLDGVTGSLQAGLDADIVLLDEDFRLSAVIARGELFPALRRVGVLSGPARPSFSRVALATALGETRRPMTGNTTTAGSDTDRQAIRDVLASLYKAWEAGDADAFVADYTDDATVVQPGVYKKDREEIRATMAAAFAGPLSGSRATDHPSAIRFLTDDTAIVISEGGIIFPGQDAVASEGLIRATWVLVRRDDSWLIASYHNSPAS